MGVTILGHHSGYLLGLRPSQRKPFALLPSQTTADGHPVVVTSSALADARIHHPPGELMLCSKQDGSDWRHCSYIVTEALDSQHDLSTAQRWVVYDCIDYEVHGVLPELRVSSLFSKAVSY